MNGRFKLDGLYLTMKYLCHVTIDWYSYIEIDKDLHFCIGKTKVKIPFLFQFPQISVVQLVHI